MKFDSSYSMSYLQKEITDEDYGLKFLFMGLAQTGKSSIIRVVFEEMDPNETNSLPATVRLNRSSFDFSNYMVNVYDTGGQISYLEELFVALRESIFSHVKALFFVVDTSKRKEFKTSQTYFIRAIKNLLDYSKDAKIRVLAHKIDLIEPDKQDEIIEEIREVFSINKFDNAELYSTSIFDENLFKIIKSVL